MKTPELAARRVTQACAASALTVVGMLLPGAASASMHFPELRGVPEHLGAHSLAVDDLCWATLLLLAVVVTLWAFHRRDRRRD